MSRKKIPTFAQIRKTLREVAARQEECAEQQKQRDAEWQKYREEQQKYREEQQKKSDAEWAKLWKSQQETDRQIRRISGDWDNRIGELVEYLMSPGLAKKFKDLGFEYDEVLRDWVIKEHGAFIAEIDVFMKNTVSAMAVEVKTKLSIEYIKDHLKRIAVLRDYANRQGDTRTYFGAVAGAIIQENARNYALSQGLYLIELSGDTVHIVPPAKPAQWKPAR
ncbi:MAG: hypothetical protein LBG87_10045 [Spirochaetaceae bacterium]|jgi:hypothetical protein|nr:hypothetical protein [Spirochaetaceae bacterium]